MSEQLSKLEILDETIRFYDENPQLRGMNDGWCVYNAGDNKHCAVGRCLLPAIKEQGSNLKGNSDSIDCLMDSQGVEELDELLTPQYRGHVRDFWSALQTFHDATENWNAKGISLQGTAKGEYLRERINRGDFN